MLVDEQRSHMSTTELAHDRTAVSIPDALESPGSKLVYLYLDAAGAATIEDLRTGLDMKRLSLYPVLDTLSNEGLVERDGETYAVAA